jgi:hypothetical protein
LATLHWSNNRSGSTPNADPLLPADSPRREKATRSNT